MLYNVKLNISRVATNLEKTWKPGILWEFSEPGKLMEFSGNSVQPQGKVITNEIISLNSCGWPVN